jgi:hypothetical protein
MGTIENLYNKAFLPMHFTILSNVLVRYSIHSPGLFFKALGCPNAKLYTLLGFTG